ncbi:hypothetical protein, variant 8 [Verruconis gallopava]|uniref:histone deacetylase n=1 Tax=Verruconis gallopava TaxID=253628 RepID=A0A0D1ZV77_9PEZI|nr:hypothetical protein, variant 7 [Verruconis gallopava]XP_016208277.1 hypothetical protein, variant 8 [Verruconis gallopava]KIV98406.1 hypothetical protein, variant 7 [Verruconis gallopava]KIV98407.1 hypothetical protein, variant 8 [Verruconis gallopava]
MDLDTEDIQMTGTNPERPPQSESAPVSIRATEVGAQALAMEDAAPVTTTNGQVSSGVDDASINIMNLPDPTQVSQLRATPQSQTFQDTASEEDGTSASQSSLPIKGTGINSHTVPRKLQGVVIYSEPAAPNLPYASQRTGLVYDPRMRFHTELEIDEDEEIHPEDPRRIYEIYNDLVQAGLVVVEGQEVDERLKPYKLIRIPAREAEAGEICLVHSQRHYEWMTTLKSLPKEQLIQMGKAADSLYLHPLSFLCAKLSAGGAIEACRAVAEGRVRNAMAVIRPPGHHAEHDKPGGFCFFDNVAIAARVCQRDFGDRCRKIMILDWDVHHGNGVQMAFEDDPNVLYISLHVHNNGKFYPSGDYGDHLHVGTGAGEGRNINIPWRTNGMTDGDYIYAFQHIVMPCAYEFNPDLVIISAGFDAAEGDMLGGCHLSPAGYAHMTHMLMSLAGGKVVACLEGGYNLRAIARSALAVTRTLMGEPPDRLSESIEASQGAVDICNLVIRTHAAYWKCLYPKNKAKNRLQNMGGERLHDMLRRLQAHEYATNYKMAELWIMREKLSKSFERQVLATDGYSDAKPLLVIFHDPPETLGEQNTHSGAFDAHNLIVTDVAKQYLEWAISQKFSVIDVNVPKYVTNEENNENFEDIDPLETRLKAMRECAMYLWENHIEPYDATDVFLMGVGDAAAAITYLLSHADDIQQRISWVFNFTCEHDLRAVQRAGDDYFADWYFKHSSCFVAHDHQAWSPERTRRVRRKYGNLIRSGSNDLNEILLEAKENVQERMMELTRKWREYESRKMSVPPPPTSNATSASTASSQRISNIRTGHSLGDELRGALPSAKISAPYLELGGAPQFGHQPEMLVRSSPGASPRREAMKSPVNKLPPMGELLFCL